MLSKNAERICEIKDRMDEIATESICPKRKSELLPEQSQLEAELSNLLKQSITDKGMKSQQEILDAMNDAGFSVVTCGNCGSVVLIEWAEVDDDNPEHSCPYCGFCSEPCDFPDLVND